MRLWTASSVGTGTSKAEISLRVLNKVTEQTSKLPWHCQKRDANGISGNDGNLIIIIDNEIIMIFST